MGLIETEKTPTQERAVLVYTCAENREGVTDSHSDELRSLAKTAGLIVVDTIRQNILRPHARYYIGQGKVAELKECVVSSEAELVLFDCDLAPGQTRNIEKDADVKVIDHTELILDIFAAHAQTRQAKLQVELAQLDYSLPRLKRMWTHLSRIKGGIGFRGPGEKQLEVDRRLARNRIGDLKKELNQIETRRERQIEARGDAFKVSLVGYTNAGKSTLMNALTDAAVLVEDKLFSTLDTRTREWTLDGRAKVLLSDTVGFINNLPHALVASFHATLEETQTADLLLHVVDASSPRAEEQIAAVRGVLAETKCSDKPTVVVLNKTDQVPDKLALRYLQTLCPDAVVVSALTGEGLPTLHARVEDQYRLSRKTVELTCDPADGRLLAFIASKADVLEKVYEDEIVRMKISVLDRYLSVIETSPSVVIQTK